MSGGGLEGTGRGLATPGAVRELLARHGLRPNKRLGQHFLVDPRIAERIVAAAGIGPGEAVLEVGPGLGALTGLMAERGALVVAVELDAGLVAALQEVLAPWQDRVRLVQGDALALDPGTLLPAGVPRKVVANLPYYITTPLLLHLLEARPAFSVLVVMMQREVAERLLSPPGSKAYGAVTVAVRYRAEAEPVCRVPRAAFWPQPEVDSAVLKLIPRPYPRPPRDEARLFAVVRAAFNQRRKTLRNALAGGGLGSPGEVEEVLARAGVDPGLRAEQLALDDFIRIADAFPP